MSTLPSTLPIDQLNTLFDEDWTKLYGPLDKVAVSGSGSGGIDDIDLRRIEATQNEVNAFLSDILKWKGLDGKEVGTD